MHRYKINIKTKAPFFFVFAISGFSGLIYESIWTHYLKLFLGHAAYAQTLVLAIFMGGMAGGAWIASKRSSNLKNLIFTYALIEGAIGIFSLFFHNMFDFATQLAYYSIIPALGSATAVSLFKWTLAASLILPQSILLGMTFPLMSGGIIRRFPGTSGATLAMLYFANSIGAAIGVLVSGFLLISLVGLPGTILAAAFINIILALVVWLLAKAAPEETGPIPAKSVTSADADAGRYRLLITAAAVTGAASFIYEIGWIRMLSLVLGASTHAFELMLSSFIFGLAFGGLWIRRRIDSVKDPIRLIGIIQIVMGVMAVATLPVYGSSFEAMSYFIKALDVTGAGYTMFNLLSHSIAMAIMLPATFCAGMTLPLITNILLQKGHGEKSIGRVYAANTAGALIGLFFAVHIGMPQLGLKGLISFGAALDMLLGIALIRAAAGSFSKPATVVAASVSIAVIAVTVIFVNLDSAEMTSGVYRTGKTTLPKGSEVVYYKDGKTATVSLMKSPNGTLVITTNGKPDASINMKKDGKAASDESTQTLLGALPLLLKPDIKTAANIGFGSGYTAHILLASPVLKTLDIIEIEKAMIDGAQLFRPMVERAFSDPRSRIYIDDAKSFFSANNKKYDLIVSEPSNPWVSGIATLFSTEFYELIVNHLQENGIFTQWFHLYEISEPLVASIIKALSPNFSDYAVYSISETDILIIGINGGNISGFNPNALNKIPLLREPLARVDINNMQDLNLLKLGSKEILDPFFASSPALPNSDYFPFLDLNATRARFQKANFSALNVMRTAPIPILEMLDGTGEKPSVTNVSHSTIYSQLKMAARATELRDLLLNGTIGDTRIPKDLKKQALLMMLMLKDCGSQDGELWLSSLMTVAGSIIPSLSPLELRSIWEKIESQPCFESLPQIDLKWFDLVKAISDRNGVMMARTAMELLNSANADEKRFQYGYLLSCVMLGYLSNGNPDIAIKSWDRYSPALLKGGQPKFILRLLHAVAEKRNANRPAARFRPGG